MWLENNEQTIVAVSSPHLTDPTDRFYDGLSLLFGAFTKATIDRERKAPYEGKPRPRHILQADPATLIREVGDMAYLQKLSHEAGITACSTEPPNDAELRAVQALRPDLQRAVRVYAIARMLPQIYRRQVQQWSAAEIAEFEEECSYWPDPKAAAASFLEPDLPTTSQYLRHYLSARQEEMPETDYHALYSPDPIRGLGSVNAASDHLFYAHDIRVSTDELCNMPSQQVVDQIFRCTNSPVFTTDLEATEELCDIQRVAVLVNRLRDRRITGLLATLALRGESLFWLAGPLHFQVAQPALHRIAKIRGLTVTTLDLRATTSADLIRI
jgi:hypothetical protein